MTFENLPLFAKPPLSTGEARKHEGMQRVEDHANAEWQQAAEQAVYHYAKHNQFLTVNDMWDGIQPLGVITKENKASGPVMTRCAKRGWIEKTDRFDTSTRPTRNCGQVAIWRSLIFNQQRGDIS